MPATTIAAQSHFLHRDLEQLGSSIRNSDPGVIDSLRSFKGYKPAMGTKLAGVDGDFNIEFNQFETNLYSKTGDED